MGDATTSVVTHALCVGSRLEECLCFAPHPRCLRTSCGGKTKRWHMQYVVQGKRPNNRKRRARRVKAAQLEQLNLNAAGIDVGATEH